MTVPHEEYIQYSTVLYYTDIIIWAGQYSRAESFVEEFRLRSSTHTTVL
jgi:hypothetical protein